MKKITLLSAIFLTVILNLKAQNKIDIDFKTGADNLEPKDFMEGLKVTIKVRNRVDIVKENVNEGRDWPNNSIRRVTFNLPDDLPCSDIYELVLSRGTRSGYRDNFTAAVADNWNLQKLTVTTRIRVNGILKSSTMNYESPSGAPNPLFRFVYEDRDSDRNTGTSFTAPISNLCPQEGGFTPRGNPDRRSITCVFGTGGDDLRGGNDNVDVRLILRGAPSRIITLQNLNNRNAWGNLSENTVSKDLPTTAPVFTFEDIERIEVRHTGGGGMFADNWYLDKFKLTLNLNGVNRILIDRVAAPIHYFTGDTRIARLMIVN